MVDNNQNKNTEELTDKQKLLIYQLGDAVSPEHIKEDKLGDRAVIVSGLEWHEWSKKDSDGNVIESGTKPKIGVQFPSLPKVFEYRIPAQTLTAMEEKLGSLSEADNILGAQVQFQKKKTGFEWVDCIVIEKPKSKDSE